MSDLIVSGARLLHGDGSIRPGSISVVDSRIAAVSTEPAGMATDAGRYPGIVAAAAQRRSAAAFIPPLGGLEREKNAFEPRVQACARRRCRCKSALLEKWQEELSRMRPDRGFPRLQYEHAVERSSCRMGAFAEERHDRRGILDYIAGPLMNELETRGSAATSLRDATVAFSFSSRGPRGATGIRT